MSKELELLNEVEKSFLYGTAGQYKEQLKTEYIEPIKQALTELEELRKVPTADEVCEALSEYYGLEVKHDYHEHEDIDKTYFNSKFYFEKKKTDIKGQEYTIQRVICIGDESGISWNAYYLPPHLITLIGRFYEGKVEE
jgi:hypothetical protein